MINEALSDISRTNQLQLTQDFEKIAEGLFQYLFSLGKSIETFNADDIDLTRYNGASLNYYQTRHRAIKYEIKKRLSEHNPSVQYSDVHYFLSNTGGKTFVLFLSPNKMQSGWKQLFCSDKSSRERILNLIFKVFLVSEGLGLEAICETDELILAHSKKLTANKQALRVWGQRLFLNYNHHNVVTLSLSRKWQLLSQDDPYKMFDGEDMGEILIYNDRKYYSSKKLDGRSSNPIKFMQFDKDDEGFEKFRKTQLYAYQNLQTKLEGFLAKCGIDYQPLPFQATHYLENSFIKQIESWDTLEVINNSGSDLSEMDQQLLENLLRYEGIPNLSFYKSGRTISTYEPVETDDGKIYWGICEIVPWADISLNTQQNYLVLNKELDGEGGSMAYQLDNGLWNPSPAIDNKEKVDFYTQLKRKYNFIKTGVFVSIQGLNINRFSAVADMDSEEDSILIYSKLNIDSSSLYTDTASQTDGQILSVDETIYHYLAKQPDNKQISDFLLKYGIKPSPEFSKVLIELGIKNWIRQCLDGQNTGLAVNAQPFSERRFFAIYVRRAKGQEAKAVAVEFLYRESRIYIQRVLRDVKEIESRFPVLRKGKKNPDQFIDDQQYLVDESDKVYISCYTDENYTPILTGRSDILQNLESGTLQINRRKDNNLLPLVMRYNREVQPVGNLVCLDLKNDSFIQYYVPPAQALRQVIKHSFRVYHMIGKTYDQKYVPTDVLVKQPIVTLHFSALTQNILKISENSQSSLLQKVAKVLIEN